MDSNTPPGPRPSLLMDLRPCYEGFAGIPQEARLLFAQFAQMGLRSLGGLASGIHFVRKRRSAAPDPTPFEHVLTQTRALIVQDTKMHHIPLLAALLPKALRRRAGHAYLIAAYGGRAEPLSQTIDPVMFEDFLWTKLFERTLAPADRAFVARARYFATEIGHENARSLCFLPRVLQRRVDTTGWDLFFGCTVSPYRVSKGTAMMIRYYDPLPLLSPHTVGEPWPHANSHARMLHRNITDGATLICDSEPIRTDVLTLFPKAEHQVRTIPCIVAPEYKPDVRPQAELRGILRRRASKATAPARERDRQPPAGPMPRLIMAVSTLEPRKNYLRLFRAFELARRTCPDPIQLLVVANPGWRSDDELAALKALVAEGAYHLAGVPLPELRVLYSMAHLVVAPSRAEGFDYSGVEAMACGAPVLASDTAVHRWVYGDAAEYADGYDEEALGDAIGGLVALPREEGKLADMQERGFRRAALYQASTLRPRWEQTVLEIAAARHTAPT